MKTLNIGNKEYKFEYSIEASLYNDCTTKTVDLMTGVMLSANEENLKELIRSLSDVPNTTLTMFYAGLLENHSDEIQSIDDAKALIKTLMRENKEDEDLSNFYGIMQILMECMSDDGFFKQIGLEQMLKADQTEEKVVPMKTTAQKTPRKTTTTKVGKK